MQRHLTLAACALLLSFGASAQLKVPKSAAAPAAPAAESAASGAEAKSPEVAEKEQAATLAAQGWLTLLDRKNWGTAWDSSSALFHKAVPLSTWMDGIPKVRADLGALVERTPAETSYKTQLEGHPPGEYVSIIFLSRFEQREVQELVTTVRERDGHWRVTGYSTR